MPIAIPCHFSQMLFHFLYRRYLGLGVFFKEVDTALKQSMLQENSITRLSKVANCGRTRRRMFGQFQLNVQIADLECHRCQMVRDVLQSGTLLTTTSAASHPKAECIPIHTLPSNWNGRTRKVGYSQMVNAFLCDNYAPRTF